MSRQSLFSAIARIAALLSRVGLPPGGAALLLASGHAALAALPVAAVLLAEARRWRGLPGAT